ncbi:hypothetical protein EYF80_063463 [Liparis tanakae]|uniref:Uncharacterized protein n=1 Tax=Liparis tanakae TaxID=230148 RepID=A0A4Z2ECD8_9TELE|nr:hypothetical protein EYF80_063463 [Liparis tanakae]
MASNAMSGVNRPVLEGRKTEERKTEERKWNEGKRWWKIRLILAPPDRFTVSTVLPEPSISFSKSTAKR